MPNAPGYEKRNDFTDLIHEVGRVNREGGALAGRSGGTAILPLGNQPMVRSAEILREPIPLTEAEVEERDRLAREIGILPPDEDAPAYPTWEAAASQGRDDRPYFPSQGLIPGPKEIVNEPPRLINFKKIQGIDLVRNIAYVDGFEIPLSEEMVRTYKKEVLDLAVDFVTKQLAEALAEVLKEGENISDSKEMHNLSGEKTTEEILLGQTKRIEENSTMQEMSGQENTELAPKKSRKTKKNNKKVE